MVTGNELIDIGTFPTKGGSLKGFLDAVTVWINKPHVVNKRICGTQIALIRSTESEDTVDKLIASALADHESNSDNDLKKHGHANDLQVDLKEHSDQFVVIIRELLPKRIKVNPGLLEAVIYDSSSHVVTFRPLCYTGVIPTLTEGGPTDASSKDSTTCSETTYSLSFQEQDAENSAIQLKSSKSLEEKTAPSFHASTLWLHDSLAPKIQQWTRLSDLATTSKTLRLVRLERYNQVYNQLKEKYGADLVKNWTETTDPQKFVYEDIGIATYLLLIWEEDRQRTGQTQKQSFVDLGCGNGLLVYILSREGHPGLGIDLRKRNIWEMFGKDVRLEEKSITPSADNLFPEFDWIIGNHSDELTPWIPVIAARSSYGCSYFVLPCCLHDFNARYNSKVKGESQYRSYLTYVQSVGRACGFQVEEDSLRIPSTKRVCQVGRRRTYPAEGEPEADRQRQEFIDLRCAAGLAAKSSSQAKGSDTLAAKRPSVEAGQGGDGGEGGGAGTENWTEGFQARSSTERVRNCQKVLPQTKERVVRFVFDSVMAAEDATTVMGHGDKPWRKGGSVPLGEVAGMLDTATREELKSECGGVQTLLRNHHNIFQVSGGKVQLRDFSVENPWSQHKTKARKVDPASVHKTSLCWFHGNHPDACPRHSDACSFAHGQAELRPRENFPKK